MSTTQEQTAGDVIKIEPVPDGGPARASDGDGAVAAAWTLRARCSRKHRARRVP